MRLSTSERAAYVDQFCEPALRGHVIIGTFALDGPERCSGLGLSVTTQRRSAKYLDLGLICRRAGSTLIKRQRERFSDSS